MKIEIDISCDETLPHPWDLDITVDGSSFHCKNGFLIGIENSFDTKEELVGYLMQITLEAINSYEASYVEKT